MAAALGSRRGCPHARPWTETLGVSFSADFRIQNRLGRRFSAYLSRLGPTRADSLESAHIRQAPLAQLYVRPYLVGAKKKLTPSVLVHGPSLRCNIVADSYGRTVNGQGRLTNGAT